MYILPTENPSFFLETLKVPLIAQQIRIFSKISPFVPYLLTSVRINCCATSTLTRINFNLISEIGMAAVLFTVCPPCLAAQNWNP